MPLQIELTQADEVQDPYDWLDELTYLIAQAITAGLETGSFIEVNGHIIPNDGTIVPKQEQEGGYVQVIELPVAAGVDSVGVSAG